MEPSPPGKKSTLTGMSFCVGAPKVVDDAVRQTQVNPVAIAPAGVIGPGEQELLVISTSPPRAWLANSAWRGKLVFLVRAQRIIAPVADEADINARHVGGRLVRRLRRERVIGIEHVFEGIARRQREAVLAQWPEQGHVRAILLVHKGRLVPAQAERREPSSSVLPKSPGTV